MGSSLNQRTAEFSLCNTFVLLLDLSFKQTSRNSGSGRVGLHSSVEDASADCFREADISVLIWVGERMGDYALIKNRCKISGVTCASWVASATRLLARWMLASTTACGGGSNPP